MHGSLSQALIQRKTEVEDAAAAAKTDTFLGQRYRRLVKRRGKLKALVAVARSILVIIWHLLANPATRFHDLGPDYYTSRIAIHGDRATTSPNSQPWATGSPSNPLPNLNTPSRNTIQSASSLGCLRDALTLTSNLTYFPVSSRIGLVAAATSGLILLHACASEEQRLHVRLHRVGAPATSGLRHQIGTRSARRGLVRDQSAGRRA